MVKWDKINPSIIAVLTRIKEEVQKTGNVTVSESKYWLMFRTKDKSFAAVNPRKKSIRIFIPCEPGSISDPRQLTRPSPSSGSWKKGYPLVFNLTEADDVDYAMNILSQAYEAVSGETLKEIEKIETEKKVPTHEELIRILCEIGDALGFVTRKEETTPDAVYRCDVTWRDYETHSPIKVFEVEVSHRIDHALSSLAHAYDTWRPEKLYLIVQDEKDEKRAERLARPFVRGAFYRIHRRLRIYDSLSVKNLYDRLQPYTELLTDLSSR